ncbi:MAG TPA: DNA polymerase III subunit gamma/tau [Vicinamibacterales bacterium]|nr:DNA polymerase III subunit gamma/tau [Vicinamibacterales bacterium]
MSVHLALARKWRPQRFEDVIGQRGTVDTLRNAIESGRLAQSFIFAGPRGVGKTTTARILARALNCIEGPTGEPCGTCDACREIAEGRDVDVMEIDGATYTGVDAVREVIVEPLSIAPMRDRFKVFIIDEVHRLSKNAFDALLKSIEEPPPYVKFMMATTALDAVPATIQSRSQVFELKALPASAIRGQLQTVTRNEGVAIDDAALALLSRAAEGSMRDALSALDQVLAFTSERVTGADVSTVLGLIGRDRQFELVDAVAREDAVAAFDLAGAVVESGFDLRIVCRELARLTRDMLLVRIDPARLADPEVAGEGERDRLRELAEQFSREDLMRAFDLLSKAESDIRYSSQPRHQFEMALVKWIHLRKLTPLTELIAAGGSQAPVAGRATRPSPPARAVVAPPSRPGGGRSAATATPAPGSPGEGGGDEAGQQDLRAKLLAAIREQNKAFAGMVVGQARKIEVAGDTVTFTFAPVHKTVRAQLEGKRAWVEQVAASVAGRRITVAVREDEAAAAPARSAGSDREAVRKAELTARAKEEPSVQAVLDVFGGEIEDVEEMK